MSLRISPACERYDRVQATFDGRVRIEGCEVNFVTRPCVYQEVLAAQALLAEDYWAYGVKASRAAFEAMTRFSFDQGLSQRRLTPEEMFPEGTLEVSKL